MMVVSTQLDLAERDLISLLSRGRERFRLQREGMLVSLVRRLPPCDPLDVFERGARISQDRTYWARPDDRFAMAGVGSAWTLVGDGARRFRTVAQQWKSACADALIDTPNLVDGTGPLLLGGFAFDPARPRTPFWEGFPDGRMILPRYLVTTAGEASWLTINRVVSSEGDDETEKPVVQRELATLLPSPNAEGLPAAPPNGVPSLPPRPLRVEDLLPAAEWQAIVASLVERLRRGAPRKVVLARAGRVRGRATWPSARVLRALQTSFPGCVTFAVARGPRCFLGATPERLVRLQGGTLRTMGLAGSIGRGATPDEDRRMRDSLLQSTKDRTEHAIVVGAIGDALAGVCSEVTVAPAPTVLTLSNVHHLFTPILGRVSPGRTILDLIEQLHPTPGVGGYPRDLALELIRAEERLDRGWYAGPVGWLDRRGDGEFAVGIRSALLSGDEATLFAGCGIVAASDPAREYAESCWKLRPVLSALEASDS
jgi:isochorismate synthase